ncbi:MULTISPECIES: DUF6731 family protein [Bacillus]|uniref:DUF6731 family protein n=1 Tax=Bacillus TaxID=1386 RepID=UPI000D02D16D|nr:MULTISPECIES: DUF6731 family protein [Bacillus]PRS78887.1 hypothetical protein C6346_16240 [Bacillus sp. CJCL2]PRS82558.1 hypothetical protein C6348_16870 [Bacillus sp. YBWC18]QNP16977.1 hypothetical protein H9S87_02920 [Bacillus pumilus]
MPLKKVRFNYFSIDLVPIDMPENMQGRDVTASWDMTEILNYLSVINNPLDGVVNVGEYIGEFDRYTILNDPDGIYSFQIAKLRETNIAKKKIGNPKEDLGLEDDEYIGEFVTVVFDPRYCTVAIQSNIYSLNLAQIEVFLTEIRNRYKERLEEEDQIPLMVSLRPIIDSSRIEKIGNSEIFRKVVVRGSNLMADSLADNGSLEEVSGLIGRASGVNFELTLSVGRAPKSESLDADLIQEIIYGFNRSNSKPKVEITARQDIESPIDVVDLLEPKLTNVISLHVENRGMVIGHEYIHREFMNEYPAQRSAIGRILQPLME